MWEQTLTEVVILNLTVQKITNFHFTFFCIGHIRSYFASKICTGKYQGNMYTCELFQFLLTLSIFRIKKKAHLYSCAPNLGRGLLVRFVHI
jgi:hypothetical protein